MYCDWCVGTWNYVPCSTWCSHLIQGWPSEALAYYWVVHLSGTNTRVASHTNSILQSLPLQVPHWRWHLSWASSSSICSIPALLRLSHSKLLTTCFNIQHNY